MAINLETLSVALKLDGSAFKTGVEQAKSSFEGIEQKLKSVGEKATAIGKNLSVKVTAPLVAFGTGAVMMAASLEQAIGKVNTVFRDSADSVLSWSTTTAESLGISRTAALDFSGTFGMILQNMGFTEEAAAEVSMQLVETAADMTAMTDVPLEQSLNALRAALVGEMEPLKNLGMGFTQAEVEAKALEMGLWDGEGALDANAKAQAALAMISERTAIAHGMFRAEADGTSGSLLIMKAMLADASAELGMHLLPIVTQVIHGLTGLIERFSGLSDNTQKVIVIFGAVAAAIGPLLIVFGTLVQSILAIKAGWVALDVTMKASTIGLIIAGIVAAIAALYLAYTTNFLGFADGVNAAISKIRGVLDKLFTHFDTLRKYFSVILEDGDYMNDWLTHFPESWRPWIQVIGEVIAKLIDLFGYFDTLKQYLRAVVEDGDYMNDWLTHFPESWQPVIQIIGQVVAAFMDAMPRIKEFVADMISAVTSALQGWIDVIRGIMQVLKGVFTGDWELIKQGVVNIVNGLVEMVKAAFEAWKATASLLMDALKVIIPAAWEFIKARVIELAGALKDGALNLLNDLRNNGVQRMTDLKNEVVARITDLKNQAVQRITEFKDSAVQRIGELKETAMARFTDLKNEAVARMTDLKNDIVARIGELKEQAIQRITELKETAIARFNDLKADALQRVTDLKNDAVARFNDFKQQAVQRITELKDSAVQRITEMKDSIIAKGQELLSGAGAQIDTLKTTITTKITEAKDSAIETVTSLASSVVEIFTGLPGDIVAALGDLGSLLVDAGKELVGGLVSGIEDSLPSLDGVVGKATDKLKFWKGSPVKPAHVHATSWGERAGEAYSEALAAGIGSAHRAVTSQISGLTGELSGAASAVTRPDGGGFSQPPVVIITPDPDKWVQYMKDARDGATFARTYGTEIMLREGV